MIIFPIRNVDELSPNWQEMLQQVHPGVAFHEGVAADLGPADAVCALITFVDGYVFCGVGNPLRPFIHLYGGHNLERGTSAFINWAKEYS